VPQLRDRLVPPGAVREGVCRFEEVAILESKGTTHAEWAGLTPATAVEREVVEVESAPVGTGT